MGIHRRLVGAAALLGVLAVSGRASAVQYFVEAPGALGSPCGDGCYTAYLRVTDIDGDGDLDILMPNGVYQTEPFVVYLNNGSGAFTNASATVVGGYAADLHQVAVGDVDADGDLDVYAPDSSGSADAFFINQGGGVLLNQAAQHLPGVGSHSEATRFADVDDDGDLDLFIGDTTALAGHLYLNDGAGTFADATGQLPQVPGQEPNDVDFFDADGDFDLDILINMHASDNYLWLNDGAGHFTDANANFPGQDGLHYGPVTCDVDGDGDLDAWVDNSGPNYTEQLLINDGAGHFTDETAARVSGNPGNDDNGIVCTDVDGDGDLDALVVALYGPGERLLLNDGTGHFTYSSGAFPNVSDATLWMELGDLNADGKLDAVTGQGESGSFIDRVYFGTDAAPVDTHPPVFRKVEVLGNVTAGAEAKVHFAVVDNTTSDEGPRLRKPFVRVTVGATSDEVRARFMGGDLFRAVLPGQPEGTSVNYEVCAVDWQGNEGCAGPLSYVVGQGGVGGAGPGGAGPSASSVGPGPGGAPGVSSADSTATGSQSASGYDDPLVLSDAGCGCTVPGRRTSDLAIVFFVALGLALRARRR